MRLRQLVKLKSNNLLVPFLTIGAISTLLGAESLDISPNPHSSTRPPSRALSMEDDQGNNASAEAGIRTEVSSRGTSTDTTPCLVFSPPPEDASETRPRLDECGISEAQKTINIFLYNDEGVMSDSFDIWKAAIGGLDVPFILESVTAADIQSGKLNTAQCDLFIMPGGRASPFHEKLQDVGKQKIREFSRCGGKCLGVGGGAYFLSHRSTFQMPSGETIVKDGVALVDASAIGPCSPAKKTRLPLDGIVFSVTYSQEKHKPQSSVFCNGGCFFEGHSADDVIAETATGQAVVIKSANNVVLSGVHPEFSAIWTCDSSLFHQVVLTQMSRDLLTQILKSLSII